MNQPATVPPEFWPRGPGSHWLTVPLDLLASVFLFVLIVLTCVDVIGREVFNSPVNAATEITQLMMPVIVFAVLPAVSYREEHVSVDLLDIWFPAKYVGHRQFVLNLILIFAFAGITWKMWGQAGDFIEFNDLTQHLGFPKGYISYFIGVMSGITCLLLVTNLIRYVRGIGPMSGGANIPADTAL